MFEKQKKPVFKKTGEFRERERERERERIGINIDKLKFIIIMFDIVEK